MIFLQIVESDFSSESHQLPPLTSILVGEVLSKCSQSAIPICYDSQVWFCSTPGSLGRFKEYSKILKCKCFC